MAEAVNSKSQHHSITDSAHNRRSWKAWCRDKFMTPNSYCHHSPRLTPAYPRNPDDSQSQPPHHMRLQVPEAIKEEQKTSVLYIITIIIMMRTDSNPIALITRRRRSCLRTACSVLRSGYIRTDCCKPWWLSTTINSILLQVWAEILGLCVSIFRKETGVERFRIDLEGYSCCLDARCEASEVDEE